VKLITKKIQWVLDAGLCFVAVSYGLELIVCGERHWIPAVAGMTFKVWWF
jgi:hypothetical protein